MAVLANLGLLLDGLREEAVGDHIADVIARDLNLGEAILDPPHGTRDEAESGVVEQHFLQAGGTLLWGTHREYSNSGPSTTGAFSFNGQSSGNSIADFLLGDAATFGQSSTQIRKNIHYPLDTFYVQDRWQATRRLSISLGLRWLVRRKVDKLTRQADERDRAKFAKAASYMVLLDDKTACKNRPCHKNIRRR